MKDLSRASNKWNNKSRECKAIIETPKGCRNKFDYDPEYRLFSLGGLLAKGLAFPFDFGFIPSTLGQDGDPLDVMILMDEPAHVGCLVDVRIIGVIEAEQTEGKKTTENNRLVAGAVHSYAHENISSISEVPKSVIGQVQEFFITYNKSRGKKFKVTGVHGPRRAAVLIDEGIKLFADKKGE
jgi:inorganic pyrophosphatase